MLTINRWLENDRIYIAQLFGDLHYRDERELLKVFSILSEDSLVVVDLKKLGNLSPEGLAAVITIYNKFEKVIFVIPEEGRVFNLLY